MPAANELLESKEANPKLLTNDLHTVNVEWGKVTSKKANVKVILP